MIDQLTTAHAQDSQGDQTMKAEKWIAWAGLFVASAALLFVILFTINTSRESGYNARVLEETREKIAVAEQNIELYRTYVEGLRQSLIARGVDVPPLPELITLPSRANPTAPPRPGNR